MDREKQQIKSGPFSKNLSPLVQKRIKNKNKLPKIQ